MGCIRQSIANKLRDVIQFSTPVQDKELLERASVEGHNVERSGAAVLLGEAERALCNLVCDLHLTSTSTIF